MDSHSCRVQTLLVEICDDGKFGNNTLDTEKRQLLAPDVIGPDIQGKGVTPKHTKPNNNLCKSVLIGFTFAKTNRDKTLLSKLRPFCYVKQS